MLCAGRSGCERRRIWWRRGSTIKPLTRLHGSRGKLWETYESRLVWCQQASPDNWQAELSRSTWILICYHKKASNHLRTLALFASRSNKFNSVRFDSYTWQKQIIFVNLNTKQNAANLTQLKSEALQILTSIAYPVWSPASSDRFAGQSFVVVQSQPIDTLMHNLLV